MNKKLERQDDDLNITVPQNDDVLCSIIIPVHGNMKYTKGAVEDLLNLPNNYEIIIIDNDSQDSTWQIVGDLINSRTSSQAKLSYIYCNKNLGFGRANNKGYKHSNGKYVIFLNNDIRVEDRFKDWPEIMLEWAREGFLVCTQGGLLDKDFNFVKEGSGLNKSDLWYASGWCLCGSRENFDKLILNHYSHDKTDEIMEGRAWGPWNEHFFAYFEDFDLTKRARDLGIKFKEVEIPVHHYGRVTGRKLHLSYMYKKSRRILRKIWKKK